MKFTETTRFTRKEYIVAFPLQSVPTVLCCQHCGKPVRQIDRATGFEILVANIVRGELSPPLQEGYDVENSELFPSKTFQVKYANARERPEEDKAIGDREVHVISGLHWTWSESRAGNADIYVLFGVLEDKVYPFVLRYHDWIEQSSLIHNGKGGRIRKTTAQEYSHCGRYANSFKRNRFWQYYVKSWPDDLLHRIKYYTNHSPMQQAMLFESPVPYSVS